MSSNAGASFSDRGILLPDPVPPGTIALDLFGDPVVGCTDSATFYYASLATNITATFPNNFTAISLSKSVDGGASFGGATIAVQEPVFLSGFGPSDMLDKEWMAVKAGRRLGSYTHYVHPFCLDWAGLSSGLSARFRVDRACGSALTRSYEQTLGQALHPAMLQAAE